MIPLMTLLLEEFVDVLSLSRVTREDCDCHLVGERVEIGGTLQSGCIEINAAEYFEDFLGFDRVEEAGAGTALVAVPELPGGEPGDGLLENARKYGAGVGADAFEGVVVEDRADQVADRCNHTMLGRELSLVMGEKRRLEPSEQGFLELRGVEVKFLANVLVLESGVDVGRELFLVADQNPLPAFSEGDQGLGWRRLRGLVENAKVELAEVGFGNASDADAGAGDDMLGGEDGFVAIFAAAEALAPLIVEFQ